MTKTIAAKCSMHIGKTLSQKHNLREFDREKWNTDKHIDYTRTPLNQIIINNDLLTFFDKNFGAALTEYNERQRPKHPERLIGFKNAADYDQCPVNLRRERAVKAYYNEHKRDTQEVILQFGDERVYKQMIDTFGQETADKLYCQCLRDMYQKWVSDNPSFVVWSAVIHMDETTPHLHLDFLPIAKSDRGLTTKISMDGALKQIGYDRPKNHKYAETPYKKWLSDYRQLNEDNTQNFWNVTRGVDVVILPSEPSKEPHEQPEDYKARKQRTEASKGAIKDFFGGKKRLKEQAAEYIIVNSSVAAEAAAEAAAEDLTAELRERERNVQAQEQINTRQAEYNAAAKHDNERTAKELDIQAARQAKTAEQQRATAAEIDRQMRELGAAIVEYEINSRTRAEEIIQDNGGAHTENGVDWCALSQIIEREGNEHGR